MKSLKYSAILGVTMLLPISALAASLALSPMSVAPKVGQTFSVSVIADPSGAKTYTTRANISFNTALVEFVSFSFAPKWIALSQTGYDAEDNVSGVLIKTAGYPGGVTSATTFGTATFRAKASGSSVISITSISMMLDSGGKNVASGTQGSMQVTVAVPVPAPTPTTPTTPAAEPTEEGAVLGEEAPVAQEPTPAPQPLASRSLLALVGSAVMPGTDSVIIGLLVVVAILALAGYAIYSMIQRARRKNFGKIR